MITGVLMVSRRAIRAAAVRSSCDLGPPPPRKLHLRFGEGVENGIAHEAAAGKLNVQVGAGEIAFLGGGGEGGFEVRRGADVQVAVVAGHVGQATARGESTMYCT